MLVGSVLLYPTFGSIFYFHYRAGVPQFLGLTWLGLLLAGATFWRRPPQDTRVGALLLAFAVTFFPPVAAYGIMLHTLFWEHEVPDLSTVFDWLAFMFTNGALFTAAYWVPFTFFNYRSLRKRAA